MHPDIVETKPGTCPLCKMNLVAARLDAAWMCPVHAAVIETAAGSCRLCGRTLVPVTVSLTWTCRGEVNAEHLEPGLCRDGSPRIAQADAAPARQPQPAARRPVLHGARQLASPRGHLSARRQLPPVRLRRLRPRAEPGGAGPDRRPRWSRKSATTPPRRRPRSCASFPLRVAKDGTYLEADPGAPRLAVAAHRQGDAQAGRARVPVRFHVRRGHGGSGGAGAANRAGRPRHAGGRARARGTATGNAADLQSKRRPSRRSLSCRRPHRRRPRSRRSWTRFAPGTPRSAR